MNRSTITSLTTRENRQFSPGEPVPVILVARAPKDACTVDRCLVQQSFSIGRAEDNQLPLNDNKISKHHLSISRDAEGFWIEDTGSTNGTFLCGKPVQGRQPLQSPAIIRVGRTVLVFNEDGAHLLDPPPLNRYGIAGRFHVKPLLAEISAAAKSMRHILLAGPSGTGKELASRALVSMLGESGAPPSLVVHNAARFTSEEEAMTTLFGVGPRVFSSVDARQGLIETAGSGVLFLDEIHNLPERIQRSLLRVMEEGLFTRIGETRPKPTKVRFVFATNAPGPTYSVAHDLLARLLLVRLPPLAERAADVPSIFERVLCERIAQHGLSHDQILPLLGGNHYEALCLDGFEDFNVRGLIDLADRLVSRISIGEDPAAAISAVFAERMSQSTVLGRAPSHSPDKKHRPFESVPPPPVTNSAPPAKGVSIYEHHKETIIATFRDREGNIAATERVLRARGIACSRRWLSVYLKKWGEEKPR